MSEVPAAIGAPLARQPSVKTRTTVLLLLSLLVASVAVPCVACGGAVEPGGSSGSSGSSGGSSGSSSGTLPIGTTTSVPPAPTTSPPGPTGPPGFFGTWSGVASGCGNFTVFAQDTSNPRYLVITASKSELGLGTIGSTATVNLASTGSAPSTSVGVDAYASAPAAPYCTDVGVAQPPFFHGGAVSGSVTFTVTSSGRDDGTYALSVALSHVVVTSQYGELENIPDITYVNVAVGWLPG